MVPGARYAGWIERNAQEPRLNEAEGYSLRPATRALSNGSVELSRAGVSHG